MRVDFTPDHLFKAAFNPNNNASPEDTNFKDMSRGINSGHATIYGVNKFNTPSLEEALVNSGSESAEHKSRYLSAITPVTTVEQRRKIAVYSQELETKFHTILGLGGAVQVEVDGEKYDAVNIAAQDENIEFYQDEQGRDVVQFRYVNPTYEVFAGIQQKYVTVPGEAVARFELFNDGNQQGAKLIYAGASNQALQAIMAAKPGEITVNAELVQQARLQERRNLQLAQEKQTQRVYAVSNRTEEDITAIVSERAAKKTLKPGERAGELTRGGWSLAGIAMAPFTPDEKALSGSGRASAVRKMNAYIDAFIDKKVPQSYVQEHDKDNIHNWIIANLGHPFLFYYQFQVSDDPMNQELFFKQFDKSVPINTVVDFVDGHLVIGLKRPLLLTDQDRQDVGVDEPVFEAEVIADIKEGHPFAAKYNFRYTSSLDVETAQSVGEPAAIAAFGMQRQALTYVVDADERDIQALPQQSNDGSLDQVEYYQTMSIYRGLSSRPAETRLAAIQATKPTLAKITARSAPSLQRAKESFVLEETLVSLEKRVDDVEAALKAYAADVHPELDLNAAKDSKGFYDIAQLPEKQRKHPKIYSTVLALGMIQRFKAQQNQPMMRDYNALLATLHSVVDRNNDKKHFWQGNRFGERVGAALGPRPILSAASLSTELALNLRRFERQQHKAHNQAKVFLFRDSFDSSEITTVDVANNLKLVRRARHIKTWANKLARAQSLSTIKAIHQEIENAHNGPDGVLSRRVYRNQTKKYLNAHTDYLGKIEMIALQKIEAIKQLNSPAQPLTPESIAETVNQFNQALDFKDWRLDLMQAEVQAVADRKMQQLTAPLVVTVKEGKEEEKAEEKEEALHLVEEFKEPDQVEDELLGYSEGAIEEVDVLAIKSQRQRSNSMPSMTAATKVGLFGSCKSRSQGTEDLPDKKHQPATVISTNV